MRQARFLSSFKKKTKQIMAHAVYQLPEKLVEGTLGMVANLEIYSLCV